MATTTNRGSSVSNYKRTTTLCNYHVFLSFRGADIRTTFADHLYVALTEAGFRTFRDDNELERGEDITFELKKAIQQSTSSIIVLSEDYASSGWCLNELVLILEQKRRNSKHVVLPVFYHVDPLEVRHQSGRLEEAFRKHQRLFVEDEDEKKEMIELWKKSLVEVADLAGLELKNQANGHEAEFIKIVVKELTKMLDCPILNLVPYTVGINSRVNDINHWLLEESADVSIAAISGMGGIGKTTIAKVVYNQNYGIFEASSFLANVREACEQHNGMIGLLKQLFSDILKGRELKTNNVDAGINQIKDALCCKRLFLVVDDVDQLDQLSSILGSLDWFCAGSKIIVTTRHEGLLKAYESCQMFKVSSLNDAESLLLFSWHAFKNYHPTECYMEHAKSIVQKCGGIPLAIQVLGTSLFGESLAVWKSAIKKMDYVFDSGILKVLRVSFDSLRDDHDKNLFLDIACFFVGENISFAVQILDECGFFSTAGLQNLVNRCLVTVLEDNTLMVHQLLQDMAREIIRQDSPNDPGSRSRVWHHKDAFEILKEKSGTGRVTGLVLNQKLLNEEEVDMETTVFSRMQNLQLLHLDYIRLSGGYREFPKKLRWLSWHGFHLKCIPSDFEMERLVALDMANSYLVNAWNGAKSLQLLKFLNLSHSLCLVNTPNFSRVPNLEELILNGCINLEVIHDSIEVLQKLVFLDLEGCKSLGNLPGKVGKLKSLKVLILSSCSNLKELPLEVCEMESLTHLFADGTAINQLPSTSGHLRNVYSFIAKVSQSFLPQISLTMIPKPIPFSLASLPMSIKQLDLGECRLTDNVMTIDMSCLSSLQYLNLRGNFFSRLPESIKDLAKLKELVLDSCTRLQSIPELPLSLRYLKAKDCLSLERIKHQKNRSRLINLRLFGCDKLSEFQNVFMLLPLVNFDMKMLRDLGLVGFESIDEGIQVEMKSNLAQSVKKGPVQGLYEFGILSTFYPCNKVPDWFSMKSIGRGMIRFKIPCRDNLKIRCFSFCAVYSCSAGVVEDNFGCMSLFVRNSSKGVVWLYTPTFEGRPTTSNEDMIWIGQSSFGNKFESGDQLLFSIRNSLAKRNQIKQVGVHVFYEKLDDKEIVQHTTNLSIANDIQEDFQSCNKDVIRAAHSLDTCGESMLGGIDRIIFRRETDQSTLEFTGNQPIIWSYQK